MAEAILGVGNTSECVLAFGSVQEMSTPLFCFILVSVWVCLSLSLRHWLQDNAEKLYFHAHHLLRHSRVDRRGSECVSGEH